MQAHTSMQPGARRTETQMETCGEARHEEGLLRAGEVTFKKGASGRPRTAPMSSSVYDNRQMGWPGLERGREGTAVFKALASPRKPPPNTTQTPRAGQMQSAQLCQPVPGSLCNWSQAFHLAFGIGQRRGEEPSAVGSQALAWPGSPSSEQGLVEEPKPGIHSSGAAVPQETAAGIRQS